MNLSEEEKDELIQDYLEQTLDATRKELLKELLEVDADFKLQFELEKAFFQERELAIQAQFEEEVKAIRQTQKPTKWRSLTNSMTFKIAASLLLIAVIGWIALGGWTGEQVIDRSGMVVFELNQTSLGMVPDPAKTVAEVELFIVKKKGYDLHYVFDGKELKLYMKDPIDIGLIRLAYQSRANMYLLYLKEKAYEIFPQTTEIRPLILFN